MNQERPSRLEPNNQILATAIDGGDPLALELPRDLDGVERPRQARVGDLDPLEAAPLERAGASRRRTVSTSGSSGTPATVPAPV